MLKRIDIFNAVKTDGLDGHQLSIDRPLRGPRNPPSGGEIIIGFNKAAVGDPVVLRQNPTSGGHLLKPAQTSTAELGVIQ